MDNRRTIIASKVQICNIALQRLGANAITSLTDNTVEARACNLVYDVIADEVMLEHAWTATIKRVELNATTDTPVYGFTYEFQLPTDPLCLRVLEIDECQAGDNPYRIEGDRLLIDDSTCNIRYIARITDTQQYGAALTNALIARLAAELSFSITGSIDNADRLYKVYKDMVENQKTLDSLQGSNDVLRKPDIVTVRY